MEVRQEVLRALRPICATLKFKSEQRPSTDSRVSVNNQRKEHCAQKDRILRMEFKMEI